MAARHVFGMAERVWGRWIPAFAGIVDVSLWLTP
jgi:hypothetical protein